METSQVSTSEPSATLASAGPSDPLAPSWKHAWRAGDEIFIDGLSIGNLNSDGLQAAAQRATPGATARQRALQPGVPHLVAEMPATLYRFIANEDRDAILIKLLFAARRLAESRLRPMGRAGMRCQQCEAVFEAHESMIHRPSCVAGQVLELLDELQKLSESELAPTGGAA